ncbi:MAG: DUF4262 domain-containing protein [Myxococcota bacterium]
MDRDTERQIISNIEQHGWSISGVMGEGGLPSWAHSIGLWHSYDHPEIIIFGLEMELVESVLKIAANRVHEGADFEDGEANDELLENHRVEFREIDDRWKSTLMGYATGFYDDESFPALQLFLPTNEGLFPWDDDFPDEINHVQPLLYESDASAAHIERLLTALGDGESK